MIPGDLVKVIEYPGSQFAGVVSEVLPDKVVANVSNGSSNWHLVYIPLEARPEHQLPQMQLIEED